MLSAFIDESGTHAKSEIMSVGAYVFDPDQYLHFARDWSEVLARFNLKYFHMVDCAHKKKLFKDWKDKDCSDLATRLVSIIKIRMRFGVVCSISSEDFAEFKAANWRTSSYTFAIQWLLKGIQEWAEEYKFQGKIAYIMERGHEKQREANYAMFRLVRDPALTTRYRYGYHGFAVKDSHLGMGLQAADILAWEWNKDFINERNGRPRNRRKSLASLLEKPHKAVYLEKELLADMLRMRAIEIESGNYTNES